MQYSIVRQGAAHDTHTRTYISKQTRILATQVTIYFKITVFMIAVANMLLSLGRTLLHLLKHPQSLWDRLGPKLVS